MPDEMTLVVEKGSDLVSQWNKDAECFLSWKFFNKVRCSDVTFAPSTYQRHDEPCVTANYSGIAYESCRREMHPWR